MESARAADVDTCNSIAFLKCTEADFRRVAASNYSSSSSQFRQTTTSKEEMGLVDYSDSESDSETPPTSTPAPPSTTTSQPPKKSFQKLVDKANPGKILVSLPTATPTASGEDRTSEEPAAKRVKTGAGRFSGFSSLLPAPKAATRPAAGARGGGGKAAPKVGINLKTSSEAAFRRDASAASADEYGAGVREEDEGGKTGLRLPPPTTSASSPAQPSIPEGQKPEEEVKLVGKPLMFKPLSVARNPAKKKSNLGKAPVAARPVSQPSTSSAQRSQPGSTASLAAPETAPPPARKKVSLFSITDDAPVVDAAPADEGASYVPEFTSYDNSTYSDVQQQYLDHATQPPTTASYNAEPHSLNSIADDLNLDPAARRELFGRGGAGAHSMAKSVINFNLDQEYRHNEELRASGALDQQQHNPLRAIKPGKHSLQQLVNAVQTQRDALEENFAKNRATQKQAGSKYGFR